MRRWIPFAKDRRARRPEFELSKGLIDGGGLVVPRHIPIPVKPLVVDLSPEVILRSQK